MTVPHISWRRLSVEELKQYYETTEEEFSQEEKKLIISAVKLVEKGRVIAFMSLDGKIRYQYWNPLLKDGR